MTRELFRETEDSGAGALDMAAVVTALERRDGIAPTPQPDPVRHGG